MNSPLEKDQTPIDPVIQSSKKSILVIDDSLDMLSLQKTMLELEGFQVFIATSGTEALNLLAKITAPDLILLDMQMEDMSGVEFLKLLELEQPSVVEEVPVVFMTGMATVPKTKAVGFIRKPAEIGKFLAEVHYYIDKGSPSTYHH